MSWRMDDLGGQVSVRQFSCIHGVEPDGWCAQCDPEESARYLEAAAMRRANEIVDTGDAWIADQWQAYRLGVYREVLAEIERSGSSCICGPDSTGEAPDVRPDCVPCNEPGADIGEDPF